MNAVSKKIGLLDHVGGGNLGDDATIDAVMHNIKRRWPEAVIYGFSLNPSDTETRHGIHSYPIRTWRPGSNNAATLKEKVKTAMNKHRFLFTTLKILNSVLIRIPTAVLKELFFLLRSFQLIRSFDLLVISGGGQLTEAWGGPWSFPYTLFKWVLLAKLSNVKCYFINVGAGPLHHPLSKYFVKHALHFAHYASFRDEQSRALVQKLGYTSKSDVFPDNVYSLDLPICNPSRNREAATPMVGISPMAYCDPRVYWDKNQAVYDSFIRQLAQFGKWLIRTRHRLMLFSSDISFDSQAIEDMRLALMTDPIDILRSVTEPPIKTTEDLLCQMAAVDYIVTCRFHGVVFAHLLQIPVLAISHHPKVETLMKDLGLSRYCLDIRHCDADDIKETFISMVKSREEITEVMTRRLARYKKNLSIQFDHLFPQEQQNGYRYGTTR